MARRAVGLVIIVVAILCIFAPLRVGELVGASPKTASDVINLRASYGGSGLGLGLILALVASLSPLRASLVHFILYLMVGIGTARLVGFVVDGHPDTRQWIWLIAEVIIIGVCLLVMRHRQKPD
jgi:hypothetical protein